MDGGPDAPPVYVIGASGRSGQALCRALLARNRAFIPVVRDPGRWAATALPGHPAVADLSTSSLAAALAEARTVVSCAHARHIPGILAAAPRAETFLFLGSTRKFTSWPDAHGDGVLAGEAAFQASGRSGVLLHPTMIYGATGEDNVQRLAALLRRLPVIPLPAGGRALVQPIHQSDVTASLLAALQRAWSGPSSLVIAGPSPLSYADFVRAVAAACGLLPPRIVSVPAWLLLAAAPVTRLPFLPTITTAEIRRLLEDKSFDIKPMVTALGFSPIALSAGLARTFGKSTECP